MNEKPHCWTTVSYISISHHIKTFHGVSTMQLSHSLSICKRYIPQGPARGLKDRRGGHLSLLHAVEWLCIMYSPGITSPLGWGEQRAMG